MANFGSTRRRLLAGIALTPALPLAACGQTSGGGGDQAGRATEAQPATVQFYFGPATASEVQLYTTLKEGFEKQHPRYRMDLLPAENEIEKMLTLMAGGTPPDVYWNRVRHSQVLMRREVLVGHLSCTQPFVG
jgi:ABC-type glycerol-3-phosphate transport system substrate-binding protein